MNNINVKIYDFLPDEAKLIRTTVFVKEQGFVDEFDRIDDESIHFVMFDNELPIATCRTLFSKERNNRIIGRFAVLKEYRNKHLGSLLLQECEKEIVKRFGHIVIEISSQIEAQGFYQKNGYEDIGEPHLDENHLHVWMKKYL